jgi:hypothetical protein
MKPLIAEFNDHHFHERTQKSFQAMFFTSAQIAAK